MGGPDETATFDKPAGSSAPRTKEHLDESVDPLITLLHTTHRRNAGNAPLLIRQLHQLASLYILDPTVSPDVAQHAISQLQKFAGKWLVSSLTWLLDAGEQGDGEGEAEDPEVLVDMVSDTLTMLAGRAALKALDKNYKFPGLGGELIIREPTADVADIGFQTWGAGVVLARLLDEGTIKLSVPPEKTNFAQTTILELGSGTGLAGLLCARIGRDSTPSSHSFHMTLTDYNPAVLDTLVYNARANNLDDVVDVSMLDWRDGAMHSWPDTEDLDDSIQTGDSKRATFDYVIASDVAYDNAVTLIPAVVDRYLSYEPHGRFWCVVPRRQRFNAELAAFLSAMGHNPKEFGVDVDSYLSDGRINHGVASSSSTVGDSALFRLTHSEDYRSDDNVIYIVLCYRRADASR